DIDRGEEYLRGLGYKNVRLRVHGDIVRLEIDKAEFDKLLECKEKITSYLKGLGFSYITLDLEGFRSGSMDIHLNK
ncbi:MAG: TIGR00268 family protein, partial [Gallicola sp.]|nr:TIGR00268 family protein [Gallicola sp.]